LTNTEKKDPKMESKAIRNRVARAATAITALMMLTFLSGCGKSVPKGDNADVKDLVVQIARESCFPDMIFPEIYENTIPPATWDSQGYLESIRVDKSYEEFMKEPVSQMSQDELMVREMMLELVNNADISLRNIRTEQIDKEILKSTNLAELIINGQEYPIRYTAQRNSEGILYVEVLPLW
jgi:hypothetical protein